MKPIILIVDDETASLQKLEEAISRRYSSDYQVVSFLKPATALGYLKKMNGAGEKIALLIVDQWMPGMNGVDFLRKAHDLHPAAQRALLVSWGDKSAAPTILKSCASGQIENYILKPWFPPEVHLFPIIGEFLSEWTRAHGPRMELVRVIGKDPSLRSHEIRLFLERNGIPHGFYPDQSEEGQALLDQIGLDGSQLPAVIMLNSRVLIDPTNSDLADELGQSAPHEQTCDLVIIGAGPAGLAAGVYGASEGLKTVIIEREAVGGQAGTSSLIRNYLGFPRGISGSELALRAYQQAWLFGAKYILAREVTGLRASGTKRIISLSDGNEINGRAVIISTGAAYRRLNIPRIERFAGAGLYYSAGSETRWLSGKNVLVAGGGNSAGQAVIHLAKNAQRVILLVRAKTLETGMSDYLISEIRRLQNVEVRLQCEAIDADGGDRLKCVIIRDNATGRTEILEIETFFVLIGAQPHTGWLANTLERDKDGFIVTGDDLNGKRSLKGSGRRTLKFQTSMAGVFAVGDVRLGSVKRVASAVGEGSVALHFVHDYLRTPVLL